MRPKLCSKVQEEDDDDDRQTHHHRTERDWTEKTPQDDVIDFQNNRW